jgi:LytS/YehU family sensor histidine kinase
MLKVPPLILQPYVENAIWHGLMQKKDKGQLDIEIAQKNNFLYLRITDNGIGRVNAACFENKSGTNHKSMGLRITANRIGLMHQSDNCESLVTIKDLMDADGNAAGTEITIKLPVKYDQLNPGR